MLVLFDVDGTLTATCGCDVKCYGDAVEQVFEIPLPSRDWNDYVHVTDTGIVDEVLRRTRGRGATPEELNVFEEAFLRLLEQEYAANPAAFQAVPGAAPLFESLLGRDDLRVALASGGMRRTAHYKLSKIGIDGAAVPGAFANNALSREGIAQRAIKAAGCDFRDVVYVGDGRWDAVTSAALGMRFIGITHEASEERLREVGAEVFLPDYREPEAFYEALARATVPKRAAVA